jgi:outer membrane protein OmpA-like peptidoglycan-associated protein
MPQRLRGRRSHIAAGVRASFRIDMEMLMRHLTAIPFALALVVSAPGHSQSASAAPASSEFDIKKTERKAPRKPVKIKSTKTEAALMFTVVDKETGAGIPGVVVCLTAPDGKKFYADETNTEGESEVAVPISQTYDITYLSLGRSDVTAKATVDGLPNHNIHLTLRYKTRRGAAAPRVVLDGVQFDTGKAQLKAESLPRLETVAEYLTHKRSARIEISGHTDNVGNSKANRELSLRRAQSCRDYLVSKGIEAARVKAVGKGDEVPVAPNDTEQGRQQNRRIEAIEL